MTYYEDVTPTSHISREILEAALRGLEQERRKIDGQIEEINRALRGGGSQAGPGRPPGRKNATKSASKSASGRRTMSEEARARIAEAQRKRWAAARGESDSEPKSGGRKAAKKSGKRVVSAEARARMAEAQRKRWAAKKA